MKNIIKILIGLFLFGFAGCTKDVDISLPEYKPMLVIHSYISPMDAGVVVYVTMSKPAYSSSFSNPINVTNANVAISDGSNTATLSFVPALFPFDFSYYYVDSNSYKIVAGKNYSITISTPDGKYATASTTIPIAVDINTLNIEKRMDSFGDSIYHLSFTFQDPVGKDDYYKFGAYLLLTDTLNSWTQSGTNEQFGTYFSADGKLISEQMEVYEYDKPMPNMIRTLDFRMMHVTREYFLYHQSIQNFDNGPFAEPSVAFTNISGGVGIFAGYNYISKLIKLP